MDTVRIVKANHAGYATINASDFDPSRHVLYGVPLPEPEKPKIEPKKPGRKAK